MEKISLAETLTRELEGLLRRRMGPVFARYNLALEDLLIPLRWKPLVLIIGNYSSGKSTFINELLGMPVQRTGQAPTDDSFTVLSRPENGAPEKNMPGSTVVSDDRLPFARLRRFGESLLAHLNLKWIDSPVLADLAIIDTPGMLDSVTEKDRGYNYLGVVGELAKLSDLIILMFDPYKAGTIKETYQAIRNTLPASTGEDRVLYVLNRVDECENVTDLVRSYGALCWNISQMTGRKDLPRIYLTFAADQAAAATGEACKIDEICINEREELKQAVKTAPQMRLNHILQDVDRAVRELIIQVQALDVFRKEWRRRMNVVLKRGGIIAFFVFCFADLIVYWLTGHPEKPFLGALLTGTVGWRHIIWPAAGGLSVIAATFILIQRFLFPRYVRSTLENLDDLIPLDNVYKQNLWAKVRNRLERLLLDQAAKQKRINHCRYLRRLERFLEVDLNAFYERI